MIAIYKREMKAYFSSIQAYIYLAIFVLITGIFFTNINIYYGYNDFTSYVLNNPYYLLFIYAIAIPIITMRSFADEKKHKTDQLLLTSPVSVIEIVCGKYFASLTLYLLGVVIITAFPIIIACNGNLPIKNTIAGYIGMLLFSSCMIAIGTFVSSLVEEPVVAMIINAVLGILIMFYSDLVAFLPDGILATSIFLGLIVLGLAALFYFDTKKVWIAGIVLVVGAGVIVGLYFLNSNWFEYGLTTCMSWISLEKRYMEFVNGIVNLSSVTYFISITVFAVFGATQMIERRRWK